MALPISDKERERVARQALVKIVAHVDYVEKETGVRLKEVFITQTEFIAIHQEGFVQGQMVPGENIKVMALTPIL